MGGQATGRRRRRKFWETWAFVGFFSLPAKAGIAHRDPSLPSSGRGETLLERVPLFICRLGWVGGRRAGDGEGRVGTGYGGEASRVLDVGGRGRGWRAKSEETVVESREREEGIEPP